MRLLSTLFALIAVALIGIYIWLRYDALMANIFIAPPEGAQTEEALNTEAPPPPAEAIVEDAQHETEEPFAKRASSPDGGPSRALREALSGGGGGAFSTESVAQPQSLQPTEDDLASQFESRPIAYNRPPSVLALNRPVDVSLVIDATDKAAPEDALEGFAGEIVTRDVELSDQVSAQLTGAAFDIELLSVERQQLSKRVQNRWQWRVTPIETGEHVLVLEIFGYASNTAAAEPLDAYTDRISVEVKQLDKLIGLARAYEPVIGIAAGIAGLFSAFFAIMRRRKKT